MNKNQKNTLWLVLGTPFFYLLMAEAILILENGTVTPIPIEIVFFIFAFVWGSCFLCLGFVSILVLILLYLGFIPLEEEITTRATKEKDRTDLALNLLEAVEEIDSRAWCIRLSIGENTTRKIANIETILGRKTRLVFDDTNKNNYVDALISVGNRLKNGDVYESEQ